MGIKKQGKRGGVDNLDFIHIYPHPRFSKIAGKNKDKIGLSTYPPV